MSTPMAARIREGWSERRTFLRRAGSEDERLAQH